MKFITGDVAKAFYSRKHESNSAPLPPIPDGWTQLVLTGADALKILETRQKWMLGLPDGIFSQCEFTRRFKRFTVQERTALLQTLLDMDLLSTDKQAKQRLDGTFCGCKTIYTVNRPALLAAIGAQN